MTPSKTDRFDELEELLRAATPLPWIVQIPGDNDPGAGTVFIDTHAYPDGPEPVIAASYPLGEADARLITEAVNALPALLAERKRLRGGFERLIEAVEEEQGIGWSMSKQRAREARSILQEGSAGSATPEEEQEHE